MLGYWQLPEETNQVLRHGKLWTGDLGYRDNEGFLYIVGRKTDMIKSGSHRIAPQEIEEVITELEGVAEVSVVGKEDKILGELIFAYVVLKPDSTIAETTILKHCRKLLPAYKIPHKIIFLEELPKSESGKVVKRALCSAKVNHETL